MLERFEKSLNVIFADGGLPDIADYLARQPRRWSTNHAKTNGATRDWDLGLGYDGAWRMARDGWSEGAMDLANRLAVAPPTLATVAHWQHDVAGELPDIGRYCAGEPMHMRHHKREKGKERAVHMLINMVASGSVSANEFANYGAAITGMIDRIEHSGRRCEIDLLCVDELRTRSLFGWKVKRAEDSCDLAAVAFAIAHPAAFRRIGFALIERLPANVETYGYGRCGDLSIEDAAALDAEDSLLIDSIQHNPGACRTLDGALSLAAAQINKAAGETLVEVE